MTSSLPPHLLQMFAPRPAIPFLPPIERPKPAHGYHGIGNFMQFFEEKTPEFFFETREERKARIKKEKAEEHARILKEKIAEYDPKNDPAVQEVDAYKTLFVSRISYDTSESKLRREFETFGPIRKCKMVCDLEGKPRGYAFIEYEHERDMKNAYKRGDGRKIDGRRVCVDVMRSTTVKGWLPRRLGGGLGGRVAGPTRLLSRDGPGHGFGGPPRREDERDFRRESRGGRDYERDRDRGDRDRRPRRDDYRDRDRDRRSSRY